MFRLLFLPSSFTLSVSEKWPNKMPPLLIHVLTNRYNYYIILKQGLLKKIQTSSLLHFRQEILLLGTQMFQKMGTNRGRHTQQHAYKHPRALGEPKRSRHVVYELHRKKLTHPSVAEKGVIVPWGSHHFGNLGYLPTSLLNAHLLLKKVDLFPPQYWSFVRVSRLFWALYFWQYTDLIKWEHFRFIS